jgi:hypothetical protein
MLAGLIFIIIRVRIYIPQQFANEFLEIFLSDEGLESD